MRPLTRYFALAAMAALMLAVPGFAETPNDPPEKTREDLEARIKALEKRVEELDGQLRERDTGQDNRGMGLNRWRDKMRGNFDDMMNQLQREMEDFAPNFGRGQQGLGQGFGQGFGMGPMNRPRLGVELDKPSPELKERFKNDVKEGAFVMSVVPSSPAEKGGIMVGDAITSFDGKSVAAPQDLIEAVRSAPKGKHELMVMRRGEQIMLKVDLGGRIAEPQAGFMDDGGWLRRGDMRDKTNAQTRTEIKASALELTDELSTELKLNDEQRKKMSDVLAKHSKALSDEVAAGNQPKGPRKGGVNIQLRGDVSQLAEKHAEEVAKELSGALSAGQIAQWNNYRKAHNSISVSQFTEIEGAGAPDEDEEGMNF